MEKEANKKACDAEEKVGERCLRRFRHHLFGKPAVYYLKTLIRLYPEKFPNTQCFEANKDDIDLQTIHPQNNEHELAVYLDSNGIDILIIEETIKQIISVRKALKQLREKEIELVIVAHATRNELMAVLNNSNVQHTIVSGHGSWNSWVDDKRKEVKNTDLEIEEEMPKKKTLIRATCGSIDINDEFEDQFGAPFSEEVYGRYNFTYLDKITSNPLTKISKNEFESEKDQKIIRPNAVKIVHFVKHFPKLFIEFEMRVLKKAIHFLTFPITVPCKICRLLFRGIYQYFHKK